MRLEQLGAELALQLLYRCRHAGLGHSEALRRPRVAGELRDADELSTIERVERNAVLAMAVFVGDAKKTRLIDNRVIG